MSIYCKKGSDSFGYNVYICQNQIKSPRLKSYRERFVKRLKLMLHSERALVFYGWGAIPNSVARAVKAGREFRIICLLMQ